MTYQVYVIENPAGKLYVGISENIALRVQQHNDGISKWTKGKGPWHLLWTSDAMSLSRLENSRTNSSDKDAVLDFTPLPGYPAPQAHNPATAGS